MANQQIGKGNESVNGMRKRGNLRWTNFCIIILCLTSSPSAPAIEIESFYRPIIDNNIFRSLDWQPRLSHSDYVLLGTLIEHDKFKSRIARAYIRVRGSDVLVVSVGDQVEDAVVREITNKTVLLLKQSRSIRIPLNPNLFLNPIMRSPLQGGSPSAPPNGESWSERQTLSAPAEQAITTEAWRTHLKQKAAQIRKQRKQLQEYLKRNQ